MLFGKGLCCNISNIQSDNAGRMLCCDVSFPNSATPDKKITLCTIYAPNEDSPGFFTSVSDVVENMSANKLIIGDFNLVMNVQMDRYGSDRNNFKSRAVLESMIQRFHLADVWRERNENTLRFSWKRGRHPNFVASRLDFILVSRGLDMMIETVRIYMVC